MKIFKFHFAKSGDNEKKGRPKKNKMLVLHRKQVVAVGLMLLIGTAGYLNWSFQNDAVDPSVSVMYEEASKKLGEAKMVNAAPKHSVEEGVVSQEKENSDYFVKARLEREMKRSEATEMLSELLKTQNTDTEARENAEQQIHRMAEYTEKEVAAENMIRAKGFRDALVFMNDSFVSVAVESKGLNEVDAAQIRDVVISATNCTADQIRIVEIATK